MRGCVNKSNRQQQPRLDDAPQVWCFLSGICQLRKESTKKSKEVYASRMAACILSQMGGVLPVMLCHSSCTHARSVNRRKVASMASFSLTLGRVAKCWHVAGLSHGSGFVRSELFWEPYEDWTFCISLRVLHDLLACTFCVSGIRVLEEI